MSESAPSTPEPHPFEKFTEFARRIVAVPKAEADEQDRKMRSERDATGKKRLPKPR